MKRATRPEPITITGGDLASLVTAGSEVSIQRWSTSADCSDMGCEM